MKKGLFSAPLQPKTTSMHRSAIKIFVDALKEGRYESMSIAWNSLKKKIRKAPRNNWKPVFNAIEEKR